MNKQHYPMQSPLNQHDELNRKFAQRLLQELSPTSSEEVTGLTLHLDPNRVDVPQVLRQESARWASAWFERRPDAFILMACNGSARNADPVQRKLRLRRLKAAMVRMGAPAERIRFTTEKIAVLDQERASDSGVAWCRVVMPDQLEAVGVQPIERILTP